MVWTCPTLRVRSAGSDDGNFAEFYLNGVKVDLESGRGISVVVLDGGSVSEKHVYDTGYQALGAGPLSALLNGLPLGTVVLVASMDDASDGLTTEAKAAIAGLGATQVGAGQNRGTSKKVVLLFALKRENKRRKTKTRTNKPRLETKPAHAESWRWRAYPTGGPMPSSASREAMR